MSNKQLNSTNGQIDQTYIEKYVKSEDLKFLVDNALDYAIITGFMQKAHSNHSNGFFQIRPFTLLPTPFPRKLFDQAKAVQMAMNILYFRVSWDYKFLMDSHKDVIKTNSFIRKLCELMTQVWGEGVKQKKSVLLQRADYLAGVYDGGLKLKQVEVNNISAGSAGMTIRITKLHRNLLSKIGLDSESIDKHHPENDAIRSQDMAMIQAWIEFDDPKAVVLFIVEDPNEVNMDQRDAEYSLEDMSNDKIVVVLMSLEECSFRLSLSERFELMLDNKKKVAVVYFRAGYIPSHYPTNETWEARLIIERSIAIKCPCIGLQLANTKKVQQKLSEPEVLEYFLSDMPYLIDEIRKTFAKMWGLENNDQTTEIAIQDAIVNPNNYVLKPQWEGGGGNIFGDELAMKLKTMSADERAAFILMEKIPAIVQRNYLVHPLQTVCKENLISELGIYGSLFGNGETKEVYANLTTGYLLRSKYASSNEGGLSMGTAVMDTPFLY
uniref:Glutathione synthetase n=1 Tax=Acrobeloides nanus TaxID=290746 RepID=A0A914DMV3_9BILA